MDFDRIPPIAKYLSVIYMLAWLGSAIVWNFLPIYFERHIESVFLIGVMTSIPAIVPILMDIPVGNLVQRAGAKIVIFLGLIGHLIPGLFYFFTVPVMLVAAKVFEGVSKSLVWNGGWTIMFENSDTETESESTSIFLLGTNLAMIVAPILGGFLIASRGFELTFAIWVFFSWLSALTFYLYIGLEGENGFVESLEELFHRQTYVDDMHHFKNNWGNLKLPLSLIFAYSIIFSFFWLAVPLLLNDLNANFETMGVIFGIAAMPKIFQFIFGEWADKIGRLKMSAVLAFVMTPLLFYMGTTENIILLGTAFFFARMMNSGLSPALHGFYDSRVPEELEGEMTGFLEFFKHSGQALGPIMAGGVASVWTVSTSFYAAAGISSLLALVCTYFGLKR